MTTNDDDDDDDDDARRRAPVPRTLTHTTRLARSSVDPDPPPSTLVPRTVPIASLGSGRSGRVGRVGRSSRTVAHCRDRPTETTEDASVGARGSRVHRKPYILTYSWRMGERVHSVMLRISMSAIYL